MHYKKVMNFNYSRFVELKLQDIVEIICHRLLFENMSILLTASSAIYKDSTSPKTTDLFLRTRITLTICATNFYALIERVTKRCHFLGRHFLQVTVGGGGGTEG